VPLATDGQDGSGLQLEKNWAAFFKFSPVSSKNNYKLVIFCSPFKNSHHTLHLPLGALRPFFVQEMFFSSDLTARHKIPVT